MSWYPWLALSWGLSTVLSLGLAPAWAPLCQILFVAFFTTWIATSVPRNPPTPSGQQLENITQTAKGPTTQVSADFPINFVFSTGSNLIVPQMWNPPTTPLTSMQLHFPNDTLATGTSLTVQYTLPGNIMSSIVNAPFRFFQVGSVTPHVVTSHVSYDVLSNSTVVTTDPFTPVLGGFIDYFLMAFNFNDATTWTELSSFSFL